MPHPLPADLLRRIRESEGPLVFLTGAGISAESGIPTFRGPEGFWRVGSRNYHPQEMATARAFSSMPDEVWRWYLHRRGVCRAAAPNAAHQALVQLDERLGERFRLVTQNVDGLHLRAGGDPARIYQIHGNIDLAAACEGARRSCARWRRTPRRRPCVAGAATACGRTSCGSTSPTTSRCTATSARCGWRRTPRR